MKTGSSVQAHSQDSAPAPTAGGLAASSPPPARPDAAVTLTPALANSAPARANPKLPNARRDRPHPASKRNEWLAADRTEARKSIALTVVLVAVLAAGVWLIVAGLRG